MRLTRNGGPGSALGPRARRRSIVLAFALFIFIPGLAQAAAITVAWDANHEPEVAGYVVFIESPSNTEASIDVGNSTVYTLANALPGVTYRFSVAAYDAGGTRSPRSTTLSAMAAAPPAAATLTSPGGTVATERPTFTWQAVPGATSYLLWVNNQSVDGKIQTAYTGTQAGCTAGGACSVVSPVPLASGASSWAVRTSNAAGDGPWSAARTFTISLPVTTPAPLPSPTPVPSTLTNGSFESGLTGWTASGNQHVASAGSHWGINAGVKAIVFNAGQNVPNAVLSQSFATTPGLTYTLTFDAGAFSLVNRDEQRLELTVRGGSAVALAKTISVTAPGTGTRYAAQQVTFVANSAATTLTFKDVSPATMNVDLLLDNVRLTELAPATMANGGFESDLAGWTATGNHSVITAPTFAAVSEGRKAVVFNAGQSVPNGVLSRTVATTAGQTYTLTFDVGAFSALNRDEQRLELTVRGGSSVVLTKTISITASGTGTGYTAQQVSFVANSASTTLTFKDVSSRTTNVDLLLDNVILLLAKANPTPPPPVAMANGGFESDLSGWTAAGNQSVITAPAFAAVSEGRKAVVFNAGQRAPNAVLSRTVATTAGQKYVLTFDAGAFSGLNRDEQRLEVVARGSASLLSRTVSVFAPGTGTRYVPQTFTFVADSASTTLTFSDRSTRTLNVDLLLDNVRVTLAAE